MRYVKAKQEQGRAEGLFEAYVAESLRLQGEGKYLSQSYIDMLHPRGEIDAESVIEHVAAVLGVQDEPARPSGEDNGAG